MEKDLEESLPQIPFWENLTQHEKETVRNNAQIRTYRAGSMLYGNCGNCLGMICVLRGSLRVYLLSEDGREVTLFRVKKGDCCVLSASCIMSQLSFATSMSAEKPSEILVLSVRTFSRLTEENIHVRCFLYEMAAERFSQVMWVLQQMIFKRFDQRLAEYLLLQSEENGTTEIYMTQAQIATEVNSAREVVARMLKQFSQEGLVELKRGCILLKNKDRLRRLL